MLQCWNANPNDRPDFSDIADLVGEMLDDKTKKVIIFCDQSMSLINLFFLLLNKKALYRIKQSIS